MFRFVVFVLLFSLCLAQSPNDRWPSYFTSFWTQYVTFDENDAPPYKSGKPKNAAVYYGTTWYDYTGATKKQFQTFPGAAFAGLGCPYDEGIICQMLNINDTVWTWTLNGPNEGQCCVEQRVWVLPPGFVHLPGVKYMGVVPVGGHGASWYSVGESEGVGPFGYMFYQDRVITPVNTSYPAAHFGHNLFSLPGWRWQTYLYFDVASHPPAEVFNVPHNCLNAKPCTPQTPPPGFGNTTTTTTSSSSHHKTKYPIKTN